MSVGDKTFLQVPLATALIGTDVIPVRQSDGVKQAPLSLLSVTAPVQSVAGRTGAVTLAAADVAGLARSATIDATNAGNITSGTLAAAQLPVATTTAPGILQVGSGLAVAGGVLSSTTSGVTPAQVQAQAGNYGVDTGTVNALAVVLSPAVTALFAGLTLRVKVATTNTGAATLNVNGLGAVAIKGSNNTAIQAGYLTAGAIVQLVYDSTANAFFLTSGPVLAPYQKVVASSYTNTCAYAVTINYYLVGGGGGGYYGGGGGSTALLVNGVVVAVANGGNGGSGVNGTAGSVATGTYSVPAGATVTVIVGGGGGAGYSGIVGGGGGAGYFGGGGGWTSGGGGGTTSGGAAGGTLATAGSSGQGGNGGWNGGVAGYGGTSTAGGASNSTGAGGGGGYGGAGGMSGAAGGLAGTFAAPGSGAAGRYQSLNASEGGQSGIAVLSYSAPAQALP
jgi:hypothetical protein